MKRIAVLVAFSVFFVPVMTFAHPGGTDDAGGHHDYNNASGLGDYHYHHGYGPHLHDGGVCPYDEPAETTTETYEETTYDYDYSSNETYTFTEDELHDYVHERVDGDPAAYNMVRIEEYEDLQRDYEALENHSTDTEDAVNDTLTGVGITAAIGIAACYYIYRRYSGEYKHGYDIGYKEGSRGIEAFRKEAHDARVDYYTHKYGQYYDERTLREALSQAKTPEETAIIQARINYIKPVTDKTLNLDDSANSSILNTKIIYCRVSFGGMMSYYYRTDNPDIQVGDMVIVPAGIDNSEAEGEVKSIKEYHIDHVPYPIEKTKFIIRKA